MKTRSGENEWVLDDCGLSKKVNDQLKEKYVEVTWLYRENKQELGSNKYEKEE